VGDYEQTTAKKKYEEGVFVSHLVFVVPWKALIDLIKPHYPKAGSKG
jgi:transposase, IS5 family